MKDRLQNFFTQAFALLFPTRNREQIVADLSPADFAYFKHPLEQLPHVTSLFAYHDARVEALIWELKYNRNMNAARLLGLTLTEAIIDELAERNLFEKLGPIILVPIPSSAQRMKERGFSQTDLICRELLKNMPADTFSISYTPKALHKIRETAKQSWSKSRRERLENLHGCFTADQSLVANKTVIVIDDVTTTGATIAEARRALVSAGAQRVLAFTIAH